MGWKKTQLGELCYRGGGFTTKHELRKRIDAKQAIVAVVGLGYVGLPLAHAMFQAGMRVMGFDIDPAKIDMLARGESYLKHLGPELTAKLSASDRFTATGDFSRLAEADAILVTVPTPLDRRGEPDLSFVLDTARSIGQTLRAGQLIVLESTTYPGTTRDEFLPAILAHAPKGTDFQHGRDFFVAYSPEREDPGRSSHTTRTTPKLVGGLDAASTELAGALYRNAVQDVVLVSAAEVAEAAKLLENIFRAVNIAMVNEMKVILTEMGIDIWEVVRAASTKPFGFMPFYPGPGLGGHCIPIDPFYLSWKAKQIGRPTRFIELAGEINTQMPHFVVQRVVEALNSQGKTIEGSAVLILGLAYKPNVDDTRESPSFELIRLLREQGATVAYSDPHVPKTHAARRHDLGMTSIELTRESLAACNVVVIATDHAAFDYALVAQHARIVVDTRDAMRSYSQQMGNRLVRA